MKLANARASGRLGRLCILCSLWPLALSQAEIVYPPYSFTTPWGMPPGRGAADGVGKLARFSTPLGVAVDNDGTLVVADTGNNAIRRVTSQGGVSTFAGLAGAPAANSPADGGGREARFFQPVAVATDGAGVVYVADGFTCIRKITPAGMVSTLAGAARGFPASVSADGTGPEARFGEIHGIAVGPDGTIYASDTGNATIRRITPDGVVTTLAGVAGQRGSADGPAGEARFMQPYGLTVDRAGFIYVADAGDCTIRKISPNGIVSTLAGVAGNRGSIDGARNEARFYFPVDLAIDPAGNLYVADSDAIRKVTPEGAVSTLAGVPVIIGPDGPRPGDFADGRGTEARFWAPFGIDIDRTGNVYVADSWNHVIRKITPEGMVSTPAGAPNAPGNGQNTDAGFRLPFGVAVDTAGDVYVADTGSATVLKLSSAGGVSVLAGMTGATGSADGIGNAVRFKAPRGVAVDAANNVYVADTGNHTIRKIALGGAVSTLAGLAGNPGSADGVGSTARFAEPGGIALDAANNVYVADTGNHTIRRITPEGVVTTLAGNASAIDANGFVRGGYAEGIGTAARFYSPRAVAVDAANNVYVADANNNVIRKITPDGLVTTLAGWAGEFGSGRGSADGVGSAARFAEPGGIAVDTANNVYVADTGNHMIRMITPGGVVTTLGGDSTLAGPLSQPVGGYADGTGRGAWFSSPASLTVDTAGTLYVADTSNKTVRKGRPALLLSMPRLAATGGVQLGICGTMGAPCALQTSTNLMDWFPAEVSLEADGTMTTVPSPAPGNTFRFYRAIVP